jgi:hypothetical protein
MVLAVCRVVAFCIYRSIQSWTEVLGACHSLVEMILFNEYPEGSNGDGLEDWYVCACSEVVMTLLLN